MKRRELLTGAAGAVLAVAPAVAMAQSGYPLSGEDSPLRALYHQ